MKNSSRYGRPIYECFLDIDEATIQRVHHVLKKDSRDFLEERLDFVFFCVSNKISVLQIDLEETSTAIEYSTKLKEYLNVRGFKLKRTDNTKRRTHFSRNANKRKATTRLG